jgi:hypothetical protein
MCGEVLTRPVEFFVLGAKLRQEGVMGFSA